MAMRSPPEEPAVEVVRAESARFRHPLLMIHGLWTGGWIWRGLAGYLAHRGWDAWLPSSCGADLESRRAGLVELALDFGAPPVLVSHDAGFATAIEVADTLAAPAVVMIAPLVHGGLDSVLSGFAWWAARLGARTVPPPRGRAAETYLTGSVEHDAAGRLVPDSGSFYRAAFTAADGSVRITRPGIVVASANDPVTSAAAAEQLATRTGLHFDLHESAGHFPMLERGFERLGDRLHRWLVHTLGEELLVMLDDEEDPT
jgi:pimeloyl-ACP methyl ester carboxylesterase